MNERPGDVLISIIIATYNAGGHLRECLQSVKSQTAEGIEVVIVDGGSTDDTMTIVKESGLPLVKWVSEPDKGIYDALNKGTAMASGKWVYFLGSDDRLQPGFSELASHLSDDHTVYYGNSTGFSTDGPVEYPLLQGSFSEYRLAKYCMNHQSIIYPKSVFRKYAYDLRYKVLADYALNLLVWGDRSFKKQHYPVTVVMYNMTGFSSGNKDKQFLKDKLQLIRKGMGWWMYLRMLLKRYKKKLLGEKDLWAPED